MSLYDLIKKRRTVRKFTTQQISEDDVLKLIDAARLSPSAANLQSLKYMAVTDEGIRKDLYPYIKYAGYTPEWNPTFEETPTAFLIVLNDTDIRATESSQCDSGIAMMSISLLAEDMGLGSCIFGAIDRPHIKKVLGIDDKFDIMYLIGVGFPDQNNSYYDSDDEIRYSLDEDTNFRVPKRNLESVIIK